MDSSMASPAVVHDFQLQTFDFEKKKKKELGLMPPITYCWTGLLILDHSYLVGKFASSKIAGTEVSGF
jgi:hypothetical protein